LRGRLHLLLRQLLWRQLRLQLLLQLLLLRHLLLLHFGSLRRFPRLQDRGDHGQRTLPHRARGLATTSRGGHRRALQRLLSAFANADDNL
jgi:hypothetical protein